MIEAHRLLISISNRFNPIGYFSHVSEQFILESFIATSFREKHSSILRAVSSAGISIPGAHYIGNSIQSSMFVAFGHLLCKDVRSFLGEDGLAFIPCFPTELGENACLLDPWTWITLRDPQLVGDLIELFSDLIIVPYTYKRFIVFRSSLVLCGRHYSRFC